MTRQQRTTVTRRGFLGVLGVGATATLAGARPGHRLQPSPRGQDERGAARNLIFLVSDGMSYGTMQLADLLQRQRTSDHQTAWCAMLDRPDVRRSLVATGSANSHVTDSAAAGTAWGIGELIDNGRIGLTPDGRMPDPMLLRARRAGKATGLVTTTRITHATPAGFACNIRGTRNDERELGQQMLDRGYDLLLGGGSRDLTPEMATASGAHVVRTTAELAAAPRDTRTRVVGLFRDSHMHYELDRPDTEPDLESMTRFALERLDRTSDQGFVVQIEGGRVDHAAHANDLGGLVYDQLAFDRAVAAALEWIDGRDDTLLVVTTDHGNANPGLTDYTSFGIRGFAKLHDFRKSFEWISEELAAGALTAERVREVVEAATALQIEPEEAEMLVRWRGGERVDPFDLANRGSGPLGSVIANHTKCAFLSPNHTADFVECSALGPGSDRLGRVADLTDIHDVCAAALDL